MNILISDMELDSVARISRIRKAVYVMQSEQNCYRFRFGGIGAVDGQANTPIRRLGQCTHVEYGSIENTWRYIALLELPLETSGAAVRELEKAVRQYFFGRPGEYLDGRVAQKDAFVTSRGAESVAVDFRRALGLPN